jgi:rhodanese-related sulfurtransferase
VHPNQLPELGIDDLPPDAVLLDVREDEEWAAGHVEGAIHIPMGQVPQRYAANPELFEPEGTLVVMCKVGGRSANVTMWLRQQGVEATNMYGGILAWEESGRPLVNEIDGEPYVY